MLKALTLTLATTGLLLAAQAPASASNTTPGEAEITALFDRWNAALATGDSAQVAALYAPFGVLQPTVSNEVRATPERIRSYFVDFLKLRPQGTINERHIEVLDDDTAVDAGIYTFDIVRDGKPQWVTARYTYVYEKVDGQWKIALHHSSAMPEPVPTRPQALAAQR